MYRTYSFGYDQGDKIRIFKGSGNKLALYVMKSVVQPFDMEIDWNRLQRVCDKPKE